MKAEATIYCEGPECEVHQHIGPDRFNRTGKIASLPPGWIWVNEFGSRNEGTLLFCCWDCVMKFAAQIPPPEVIDGDVDDT